MSLRRNILILGTSAGLLSCNPYKNLDGDYYLGPVDPSCPQHQPSGAGTACNPFPDDYLGAGFMLANSNGTIQPNPATAAGGTSVLYYGFHVSAAFDPNKFAAFGLGAAANPLRLRKQTTDAAGVVTDTDRQRFYTFDSAPGAEDGKTDSNKCSPPSSDYIFDQRRDTFPFNRQLNVFQQKQASTDPVSLPSDQPSYMPIYAEVSVTTNKFDCQSIHSSDGLVDGVAAGKVTLDLNPAPIGSLDFRRVGKPTGNYLALAIIDPSADVLNVSDPAGACPMPQNDLMGTCRDPITHLGPQRFGFFDHFMVAYIDGGYVPTAISADQTTTAALPMTLYAPNSFTGADGKPATCDPGDPVSCIGHGLDVIDGVGGKIGVRDAANNGYSPICHVRSYSIMANGNKTAVTKADIAPAALDPDVANAFVYCLQVAQ